MLISLIVMKKLTKFRLNFALECFADYESAMKYTIQNNLVCYT